MRIPMPGLDRLPDGPHRELLVEVHRLHEEVGWPGLQKTSAAIKVRRDLPDTISHEAISKILHGKTFPQWLKLESLVRQYLTWNTHRRQEIDAEVRRLQTLWMRAASAIEGTEKAQPGSTEHWPYPQEAARQANAMAARGEQAEVLRFLHACAEQDGVLAVALAVMPSLPEAALLLLQNAGTSLSDPEILELLDQVGAQPTAFWHGHDPVLAIMKGVLRVRADYGIPLVTALRSRPDAQWTLVPLMTVAAQSLDPANLGAFIEKICALPDSLPLMPPLFTAVMDNAPRPVVQVVVQQLRKTGQRREADALASRLSHRPEGDQGERQEHPGIPFPDEELERVRTVLRKAGCREDGAPGGGFTAEIELDRILVTCTCRVARMADKQLELYQDALTEAGYKAYTYARRINTVSVRRLTTKITNDMKI
ncbi:hypothetical protein [Streptomyces mobaraensis]|uniref:Uncharacterized protein n=1 Tax=Streptomyces mobaraensis TaxID=35621 RepID=A0A5N5VXI7_STRMB|nr:hypothetical protein [Streptomyces mobaraensis]KAB7833566.1 hypothetical protein FRZ00_33540 [Streptomyces mobaraensis]